MNPACGNCRYFHLTNPGGSETTAKGQCRIRSVVTFPVRLVDESCGEHQSRTDRGVNLMEAEQGTILKPRGGTEYVPGKPYGEEFPHPGCR